MGRCSGKHLVQGEIPEQRRDEGENKVNMGRVDKKDKMRRDAYRVIVKWNDDEEEKRGAIEA